MKDRIYKAIIAMLFAAWVMMFISFLTVASNADEEKHDISADRVTDMPEIEIDKPEYHVEATETSVFDANTLDWDYSYVMRVVGAECRGEPADGIKAVCEVIANRAEMYGMNPEEVVKQEGQFAEPMPTEFYDGGEMVNEMCLMTFACGERWFEEPIMAFCSTDCNSAWHNSLRYVCTIGGHSFYARWE